MFNKYNMEQKNNKTLLYPNGGRGSKGLESASLILKTEVPLYILPPEKTVALEKPKTKRVVTETEKWAFSTEELKPESQYNHVKPLFSGLKGDLSKNQQFILQQIKNKISGYKSQDNEKKKYDLEKFVTETSVLTLFESSRLQCYYCQDPTLVLYEFVRDPKQWSLERLDNSKGHNTDNVVLACLKCNLKRRCIHSDRYLKTKQMTNVLKLT